MTVAFVFQGGASLSAAQVGMVRALTRAGIRPDLVVGSSAGALNAVAYAQDPTERGLDELQSLWTSTRRGDVFSLNLRALIAGMTGRGDSLGMSHGLRALIEHGLRVHDLTGTVVPAHVMTCDAATGEPVVLSEGSALQALLASSAIPGLLPPVPWRGRLLVDGSVAADVPVLQAEELGATVTYVLPSVSPKTQSEFPTSGALPMMARTLGILLNRATARDLAAARGQVHVLPAPSVRGLSPLDFKHSAELIRLGYSTTRHWLADRAGLGTAA